ncbi:transporter [Pseudomonas sp. 2822-15]|uniref:autotransporter-associated beta strand repeat-containing protein n=1 Tax=Pseudomonas sp. 2822-15 TaxID=1712677 RepID=UPI000C15416D|nr:transporter [Pseudomonas sp. 2822-15]
MDRRLATAVAPRISALSLAIRLGVAGLVMGLASPAAMAACSPASPTTGATVTCTGVPSLPLLLNTFSSAVNNLTVNVNPGAQLNATLGGIALNLTGNNTTLNNSGTIDPAVLGLVSVLSGGVLVGNTAASAVNITNTATGIIRGTGALLGLNLTSLAGAALNVTNGVGGTTTLTNAGALGSNPLLGLSLFASDTPVVAVQGGGQVNMTNSGTLTGRVAFEASTLGNTFVNSGIISGGVSMGASSANTFTAVTGSSVSSGGGIGLSLGGLVGVNLTFAPTGQVDGGANGSNTLILKNPGGVGSSGTGTASSATYINFNNLTINGGTWTLLGPLVSGSTTLNGGISQFDNSATFGTGAITANGGIIEATANNLTLANLLTLGTGGLTVQGANTGLTLGGVLSGTGGLTKAGTGQLILNTANTYTGATTLSGGSVQLGNDLALSSGAVTVTAATTLQAPGTISLANALTLNGNLITDAAGSLSLDGAITGTSGLTQSGAGSLTLNGVNTGYSGATSLGAGTLVLGNNNALGSGNLNVTGTANLNTSGASLLNNNVVLTGDLSLVNANPLTLSGVMSGVGGLTKTGAGLLTLAGNNTRTGITSLDAGGLLLSSNTALGTGALNTAAGTSLGATTAVNLANAVNLAGNLGIGGTADLTLAGTINGAGSLTKNGAANLLLNGPNNFLGGTTLNAGTLTLGSNAALGLGNLTVGGASTLDSNGAFSLGNNVVLNAGLTLGGTNNLTLAGVLSGAGPLTKNGLANLTLNGNNTFSGGTTLNAGTLTLGNANGLGNGALTVGGAATLDTSASFGIGNAIAMNADLTVAGNNDLSLNGVVSGAGNLIKNGLSDLTLAGNNTFTGAVDVVSGSLTLVNANALGSTAGVNVSAGAGVNLAADVSLAGLSGSGGVQLSGANTLTVGGVNTTSTFDGDVSGTGGLIKVGTGTLNLTGINGVTGNTAINAGTLNLSGSLASAQVNVNNGGTLTGTGSLLGALNVNNGGHLALSSGNTLSAGALNMVAGGNLDVALGAPSLTSLLNVGGNVALAGNLNVTDAGGFGAGTYRLINYTGGLTGGLTVAGVPVGYGLGDLLVQTSVGNQVNLVVAAPNIRFWDGSQAVANGVVDGGTGTWTAGGTNWTSADGLTNSPWASGFAVFTGAAGTVAVQGPQAFTGLQFVSDGYNLVSGAGGQLTAINGGSGNVSMRVDPGATATVGVNIDGAGTLNKLDTGTLVLNGANTYTGGTLLNGGRLIVGSNTALGGGLLTTAAGTTLDSNAAITLGNTLLLNGDTNVAGSNALTLNGGISGVGGLIKNGAATLTLGASNTFLGPVALNAGGLILAANNALGAGALNAAGGTTLDASAAVTANNAINLAGNLGIGGTADLTLGGAINGAGSLTKNGAANLTLNGLNAYSGGTTLNAGTLTLGTATALGTGALTVGGAANLNNGTPLVLANAVNVNANLTVGSLNNNLTLAGGVGGSANLIKTGTGDLALTGNNTFSGLFDVQSGSLSTLGNDALGAGAGVNLGSGTQLNMGGSASLGELTGNGVAVVGTGSTLSVGSNNLDSTFGGVLAGLGGLNKIGSGALTLGGLSVLTGDTQVNAGSLLVNGALDSTNVNVANGATLGGTGTLVGAVNIADGGHLAVNSGNTLTLGSLVLNTNSNLDAGLGAPSTGGTALIHVGGNLTLDGTLNVSDIGGFGPGIYRLIDYTGGLTNNGLQLGSLPVNIPASDLDLQTVIGNQINLLVTGNTTVRFWDGSQTTGNGSIEGGSGTWTTAATNWTGVNGSFNTAWAPNSFAVFQGAAGTVTVDGAQAITGLQFVNDGYNVVGGTAGALTLFNGTGGNTAVRVDPNATATLGVTLNGGGTLAKLDAGTLVLNGANTYTGGTTLAAGTLTVGNATGLGSGALTVTGASTLDNSVPLVLANAINLNADLNVAGNNNLTLAGVLAGNAALIKNGAADLLLSGNNTFSGPLNVLGGSVTTAGNAALGNTSGVNVGGGASLILGGNASLNTLAGTGAIQVAGGSTLAVGGSNLDNTFAGTLSGAGNLDKNGSGVLNLSGTNGISGAANVNGGTLNVSGSLASGTVAVNTGATLTGPGSLAGAVTVADGGHIGLTSGSTLSVGSLVLGSNANLDVGLGVPVMGGGSGLLNVGGDLTLGGNLNVTDIGGFGSGVYNIINYGGALTNNGLALGTLPGSVIPGDVQVQTAISNKVNLLVTAPNTTVQFWDGANLIGNGAIDGGNGTWGAGTTNWTNLDGTLNQNWNNSFAVFQGPAGNVSVEGTQNLTGLQFVTDGYNLASGTAGVLNLVNGGTGNTAIRVDPNATATLDVTLGGAGTLAKLDTGTLVLNGTNTYTGGTALNGGTLVVGNNSALGSAALTAADGTTLDSNAAVTLGNAAVLNGSLAIGGSNALTLNGSLSGNGSLLKKGAATLTLKGANTYSGGTTLNGGTTTGDTNSLQGAIANNAALTFEQGTDGTYTGNLTGAGVLNKTGSGALLLSGDNTFTGNTNVNAGSLLVNGSLNSAAVQVASGATLGGSGSLGGAVTMADGSTLKAGAATPLSVGSLALSSGTALDFTLGAPGASTTAVNVAGNLTLDGTLNVTDAGGFGLGVYQLFRYGGALTDNGLTLGSLPVGLGNLSLQTSLANQLNLLVQTTPGQIQFWNGGTTNPDGTITGGSGTWGPGTNWTDPTGTQGQVSNNQFAVFGGQGGTVTVVGNQGFTGLQFLDPGYTLTAGAGGTLSPTGTAVVRVNSGVTTEVAAPIVGAGAINKLDAGTLLLTGANTYTGGTTVSGGTLAGNALSLQGRIFNNARLLFVQRTSGTFNGVLSGTGNITKQGAGALLLTGNQPFSGTVAVDEGVLQVGNAANPGAVFGGQVSVANGAGLTGNGSVGALVNNGSVTPDNGKLTVAGNFTNGNTGALNLLITPSSTGSLAVGGTANLGGTLNVVNLAPYAGPATYTLLTAGAVNGTFGTTNLENLAFLNTALNYSPTQVALAVSRNNVSYASVAATGNQRGVAAALDSGAAVGGATVQNALLNSNVAGARAAFDSLSGEIHASTASAMLEDSRYVRDAVNERLRQPGCYREDDPRNSLAPSENRLSSAGCHGEMVGWMRVLGTWGHMGGDSNTAKLDRNLGGFLLGTDKQVDDAWRVGVAAGYTRSDLDAKRRSSSADVDSYHLMAYTAYQQEAFAARLGVAYSWHDIESKRDVAVGGVGQRLKADYKARSAQVFGEVGYTIETGKVVVEPFAGLAYVNYDSDTVKEKGGSAALRGDADQDVTFSTLGVRLGQTITLGNGSKITPRGSIGWRHAFGDTQPDADLSFINGGASFSTQGVPIAKDSAVVEAGLDYQISQNGKLGLGYSGQLSRNDKDHAMTISFSLGF